jgi:hypothetical protein
LLHTATGSSSSFAEFLLLMQAAAATASRFGVWWTKFVALLHAGKTLRRRERSFWLRDGLFEMSDLEGIKGWALKIDIPSAIDLIIQS